MNEIQHKILEQLAGVERDYNVKIPYAVESGSRAWGFASPDSDYDCRFIYVRSCSDYLTVFNQPDTIEFTPDAIYDVGGWDLKKVILHLVKSNAVMLEWLQSPISYRQDDRFRSELMELGREFFSPVAVSWHYLSMAKKKVEEISSAEEVKIKKYFYALRPLACTAYIREHNAVPAMEYRENLKHIPLPPAVIEEIHRLLEAKAVAKEGHLIRKNQLLLSYFQEECIKAEEWLKSVKHQKMQRPELADEVYRAMIAHSWREKQ